MAPPAHRARLPHARVLPAHRPHPGGRQVPPRLLRRPPRDARPLRRRHGGGAPAGDPGGQARSRPPDDRDGARDEPSRPRRHLLDDLFRALSRRPGVRHPRPHDRRAGGLERGHLAERLRGREFRSHRAPSARSPLRPRRRVHGSRARQLGRLGGWRRALRPGRPRLRGSGQGAPTRVRGRVVPNPWNVHRAVDPPGPAGDHPGRAERSGARVRGALGRDPLRHLPEPRIRPAGLPRHEGGSRGRRGGIPIKSRSAPPSTASPARPAQSPRTRRPTSRGSRPPSTPWCSSPRP